MNLSDMFNALHNWFDHRENNGLFTPTGVEVVHKDGTWFITFSHKNTFRRLHVTDLAIDAENFRYGFLYQSFTASVTELEKDA